MLLLLGSLINAPTVLAQDQDSTVVVTDSTQITSDSLSVAPDSLIRVPARATPLFMSDFFASDSTYAGQPRGWDLPFIHPDIEVQEQLGQIPGSFLSDLSTPGWPSEWTMRNRLPNSMNLSWDGLKFDELFTGRPAYELLPRGLSNSWVGLTGTHADPIVQATVRNLNPVGSNTPLTELYYRTGNKGLQYVYASHGQARTREILGHPTRIQITTGYLGEKADGEYGGSKLKRARNVFGSVRLQSSGPHGLTVELSDMSNRRRIGAHGGIVPPVPSDPNSIYQRFGAFGRDGSAERRTKRNDLTTTVSLLTHNVGVTWKSRRTSQFFHFRNSSDTLIVASKRYTSQLDLERRLGRLAVNLKGMASTEGIEDGSFLGDADTPTASRYSVLGSISTLGFLQAHAAGGLNQSLGQTSYEASFQVSSANSGILKYDIAASRSVPDPGLIVLAGFGNSATISSSSTLGYVNDGNVHVGIESHGLSLDVDGFAVVSENPRDWFTTSNPDSIVYRSVGADVVSLGTTVGLGFRANKARGFYVNIDGTMINTSTPRIVTPGIVFPGDVGPPQYATMSVGLRYLLFKNDLDGDFSLRARMWPDFTGRVLHRQTGLMAIPSSPDINIESSVALDLVVEAGIRGATVFLTYENLLSGTDLIIGNQLVPGYPLAQRRLRFGVFWPIKN